MASSPPKSQPKNAAPGSGVLTPSSPDLRIYETPENGPPFWEKQFDETQPAYAYFCYYRDMGRTRTIRTAFEAYLSAEMAAGRTPQSVSPSHHGYPRRWGEYSIANKWRERAEAYDDFMEIEARERRLKMQDVEIEEYRIRARQLAIAKTNLGAKFLTYGDEMLSRMRARDAYSEKKRKASGIDYPNEADKKAQGIIEPTPLEDYRQLTVIIKNASAITDSGMDNEAAMVGVTRLQNILDEQERQGDV